MPTSASDGSRATTRHPLARPRPSPRAAPRPRPAAKSAPSVGRDTTCRARPARRPASRRVGAEHADDHRRVRAAQRPDPAQIVAPPGPGEVDQGVAEAGCWRSCAAVGVSRSVPERRVGLGEQVEVAAGCRWPPGRRTDRPADQAQRDRQVLPDRRGHDRRGRLARRLEGLAAARRPHAGRRRRGRRAAPPAAAGWCPGARAPSARRPGPWCASARAAARRRPRTPAACRR